MRAWLLAGFIALLSLHPAAAHAKITQESYEVAVTEAKNWLAAVDHEKYADSWDMASSYFKSLLGRDDWVKVVTDMRDKVGKAGSRTITVQQPTQTLPDGPKGDYFIIKFTTQFERKPNALEVITMTRDKDSRWRMAGYYVK